MADNGCYPRKTSFHATGGVAANIVPWHKVTVDVAVMNQRKIAAACKSCPGNYQSSDYG
jgi:hypothetical protein